MVTTHHACNKLSHRCLNFSNPMRTIPLQLQIGTKPEAMDFVWQCLRNARSMYQLNVVLVIDNALCVLLSRKFFTKVN
ncbi:hypothetical protein M0802_016850 [Mischocyttarus mexicanus]|nr:hypothetical protein M0802_016850 [Mischocyttarus mexicanus]